jgi:hypothetical protein
MNFNYFFAIIFTFFIISSNFQAFAKPIKVLFIGNSFTHMNRFPDMVSEIAKEQGDTIITAYSAFDSYTLEQHYSHSETLEKIKSDCWDYVVLQEQSQRPAMDSLTFYNKTFFYVNAFVDLIYEHNPESQILLFLTWGRKYGDKELCAKFQWTCTYEDMQQMLARRYFYLGSKLALLVVPCGLAWLDFAPNNPQHFDLFAEDNRHPNAAGSYLNACIFYSAITNKSAVGTKYNPAGIEHNVLLELQKVAYNTVKKYIYNFIEPFN